MAAGPDWIVNGAAVQNHFSFADGDTLKIFSLDPSQKPVRWNPAVSFIVRNRDRLDFYHPSPKTLGINEDLLRTSSESPKPLFVSTSALPYSVFPTAHYPNESRKFTGLSAFVQTEVPQEDEGIFEKWKQSILDFFSVKNEKLEVVTDQGTYQPSYGEPFTLGTTDRMIFSIDRVQFPWALIQALLILFLLKSLFQPPFFFAGENLGAQLILINIDFFLVSRCLFAFRAANQYPFFSEGIHLALLAILLVPYLTFSAAMCSKKDWDRTNFYNFASYTIFFLLAGALLLKSEIHLLLLIALAGFGLAFLRFHARSPWERIQPVLESAKKITVEKYLVAFFVLALIVQFFGAGEAVKIGGLRVPLAFFYHPVFLACVCYYFFQLKKLLDFSDTTESVRAAWKILLKIVAVLTGFLFVSFLVSDFG